MVKLRDVILIYPNGAVGLDNVSLNIDDGEFCFIIGPSGSGKSSLFHIISGEERASKGTVSVNNFIYAECNKRQIAEARRSIGMVFQDFRLIDSMTIDENLEFSMRCVGANRNMIEKRIPEVLEMVGLPHKMDCRPSELSGGEKQRAAIARAIINQPRTLLADEPTGNLDPSLSQDIMELFVRINEASGATTIVITHAKELVEKYQKRVVTISKGRIVHDEVGIYLDRKAISEL